MNAAPDLNSIDEEKQAQIARLRWRCRRGMLELDLFLQAFLDRGYDHLSDSEKEHFYRLLDLGDQDLLEVLMLQKQPEDSALNDIVQAIRSTV